MRICMDDGGRIQVGAWVGLLMGIAIIGGCAGAPAVQPAPLALRAEKMPSRPAPGSGFNLEKRLRAEAGRWAGTPHRLGGNGAGGIDCSGLTMQICRNILGVDLPRTTLEQARSGVPVERGALIPGDLVFFRIPGKKLRHVGVYLGRGEFVHASASMGVMISRLDAVYWLRVYWTARRIS